MLSDMTTQAQRRNTLRKQARTIRSQLSRELTPEQKLSAAHSVAERATALPAFKARTSKNTAVYFTNTDEISTEPLIQSCKRAGHQLCAPVLHPFHSGRLLFISWAGNSELPKNKYGIAEPELACNAIIPLEQVQLMFVPLVAFDAKGNRMGMGGGYYDRTLARWANGSLPHFLPVGLAYDEQQVSEIPAEPWDVPLPIILTPSKTWIFNDVSIR